MSKTREKKVLITEEITPEEANAIFAMYAEADAKLAKIQAEKDLAITKIREKYQDKEVQLIETKDKSFEKLQHYAMCNPDLFKVKKSIELPHGKIGFRTGTPKLKCLFKKWDDALSKVKEMLPTYVRVKEELDKEGLLANKDNEEVARLFPLCGVKVEQDESFFVEAKKEEV